MEVALADPKPAPSPADRIAKNRNKGGKPAAVTVPDTLRDARHVYNTANKKGAVDTPGQSIYRAMLKEDREGFMKRYEAMEKDHRDRCAAANQARLLASSKAAGSAEVVSDDESDLNVTALLKKLIEGFQ